MNYHMLTTFHVPNTMHISLFNPNSSKNMVFSSPFTEDRSEAQTLSLFKVTSKLVSDRIKIQTKCVWLQKPCCLCYTIFVEMGTTGWNQGEEKRKKKTIRTKKNYWKRKHFVLSYFGGTSKGFRKAAENLESWFWKLESCIPQLVIFWEFFYAIKIQFSELVCYLQNDILMG